MSTQKSFVATEIRQIPFHSFDTEEGKNINKYSIQKKLTNFNNIFFYLKVVVEILSARTDTFKTDPNVNADYFDMVFVMTKKIREAVLDGFNEYNRLKSEGK